MPQVGRYLVESDVETRATVALLGEKIKKDVFGEEEALGREILIRRRITRPVNAAFLKG